MTSNKRHRQFNQISERMGRQIRITNKEKLIISHLVRLMSLLVKSAWTHKYVCNESMVDSLVQVNAAHAASGPFKQFQHFLQHAFKQVVRHC